MKCRMTFLESRRYGNGQNVPPISSLQFETETLFLQLTSKSRDKSPNFRLGASLSEDFKFLKFFS